MTETLIKNFTQISKTDTEIAGGKGASLGEMAQVGIPVPKGFVILSNAFDRFLEETDLNVEIDAVFDTVDIKEVHTIENASEKIKAMTLSKDMPQDIKTEILKFYKNLDCKFVAVRSSATSEDSASAAWAGQLDSFLNTTNDTLLENVKKCWASLFTPRAIFYRFEKKLNKDKISVAVVVQKMVDSEVSGIAFSVHPVTQDENQIIIEAGFGLGEAIVSGSITPDSYVVDKQGFSILDINVNEQTKALYKKAKGGNEWKELGEKGKKQVLTEKEIIELSKLIVKIEDNYGFPCDIEWAKEKRKFYIVQSRPITTFSKEKVAQNLVQDYNWIKVVERQNSPLFLNFICSGITDKYTEKVLETKLGYDFYVYLNGEVYITTKSSKNLGNKFNLLLQEKGLVAIEKFLDKWYEISDKLLTDSKKSKDILNNDNEKISKIFSKITEEYYSLSTALMLVLPVEKYLEEEIKYFLNEKKRKNVDEELFILTHPDKRNENEFENDALRKIAEVIKKDKISLEKSNEKLNTLISEHIENFGWINTDRFFKDKWSKKDILDRLSSKIKEKTNQTLHKNEEELCKELNLSSRQKTIIKIAKEYVYFRTYRMNVFMKAGFFLRDLLSEIAKRLDMDFRTITYMTPDEIIKSLQGNKDISEKEIKQRFKEYGYYVKGDSVETLSGDIYERFKEQYFSKMDKLSEDELKGTIAHKGKTKGIVKVVRATSDLGKVKNNDILVAPMTIPSFVPAMEKASAFVTDEGGILCHAAIVSREMKKPCIIGTKIATKILSDGDLVEVDANQGIIKILKKAKK